MASLTKEKEQAAIMRAFQKSADGDGALTSEQIHSAMALVGVKVAVAKVRAIVAKCGGGTVGVDEYVNAVSGNNAPPLLLSQDQLAALETRFRAADTDGTGTLSREDLRRALADADGTDDARLATLFERADTNESGGVDLDEFVAIASSAPPSGSGSWWRRSWLGTSQRTLDVARFAGLSNPQTEFFTDTFRAMATHGTVFASDLLKTLSELGVEISPEGAKEMLRRAEVADDHHIPLETFLGLMVQHRAKAKRWQLWWIGWAPAPEKGKPTAAPAEARGPDVRSQLSLSQKATSAILAHTLLCGAEQLRKYSAIFEEIDEDRSGFICPKELRACLRKIGAKASEKEAKQILKRADLNGNGSLDLDEFLQALALSRPTGWNSLFRYALGGATAAAKKFEKKPDFGSKKGGRSSDAPQSVAKPKRASKTAKKYRVSPVERSADDDDTGDARDPSSQGAERARAEARGRADGCDDAPRADADEPLASEPQLVGAMRALLQSKTDQGTLSLEDLITALVGDAPEAAEARVDYDRKLAELQILAQLAQDGAGRVDLESFLRLVAERARDAAEGSVLRSWQPSVDVCAETAETDEDEADEDEAETPQAALRNEVCAFLAQRGSFRGFVSTGQSGMQIEKNSGFLFGDTYCLGPPRGDAGADADAVDLKMRMDWVLAMVLIETQRELPCHVKVLHRKLGTAGWTRAVAEWDQVVRALSDAGVVRATYGDRENPYEVYWPPSA